MKLRLLSMVAMLLVSFASSELSAGIILPSDLNPGDHYRIAFVTSGARDATSSDIADYNAFVTAQAAMSPDLALLSTDWHAIGSTASVDARTNTLTRPGDVSNPIYNTNGVLVASSNVDLWDGSIAVPIQFNQFGFSTYVGVYTGTNSDGTPADGLQLGSSYVKYGLSSPYYNYNWTQAYTDNALQGFRYYALSGDLVVPYAAVPEPTAFSTFGILAVVCGFGYRRRTMYISKAG